MSNNLYLLLQRRYPKSANAVFLKHCRGDLLYSEIDARTGQYVAVLRQAGAKIGDRVMVQVDKSPEAVLLYLACLRVGAIFIPLNTGYMPGEIDFLVGDAKPTIIVCRPKALATISEIAEKHGVAEILTLGSDGQGSLVDGASALAPDSEIAERDKDDIAAILYTSGTTGKPKGAMLSHDNLASNALVIHEYWAWEPGDVLLHALPIFHVHGLFVALHCALLNGSPVVFMNRFEIDPVLDALPGCTVMMGVPTFYTRLLDEPRFDKDICANMRLFLAGSAPLLSETFDLFATRTGHRIVERYGMTEAGMITSNPYHGARVAGSVGYALPGVSARVAGDDGIEVARDEPGILEIKGANVFKGYWGLPEKTREEFHSDGYFKTGDVATMAEDGRIAIVGRAKDLVISGGFNVYPKEVEGEIDAIEGVRESAIIGVPHPDFGEGVTAIVVLEDGSSINAEVIADFLKDRIARFKQPKKIIFLSELPRNTMGKVQKQALRAEYAGLYTGTGA